MKLIIPDNWIELLLTTEIQKLELLSHPRRKLEFICSRILRTKLFGRVELSYNEYGAPVLNGNFISISHSSKYVAIAHSNTDKTAIDIDFVRPSIQKLFPKFAHITEYNWVNKEDKTMQMQLWSMKEALYKHYQKRGILFAKQLKISPISKHQFLGEISGIEHSYQIKLESRIYPEFDDLIISYTFGKNYYL